MKKILTLTLFTVALFTKTSISMAQTANVGDSLILVDFYKNTYGGSWTSKTGWLTGPLHTWKGVTLDDNGRVTSLVLASNNLYGSIPSSLGGLEKLAVLDLRINNLFGGIPGELGNLTQLTQLNLSSCGLIGEIPPSFAGLNNLLSVSLSNNLLKGYPLLALSSLTYIQSINLSKNAFAKAMPSSLDNFINLKYLNLSNCQLTGALPQSIGKLTSLQTLILDHNSLTGVIPDTIGKLVNLGYLALNNNQLTGPIPQGIGNIPGMGHLYLNNNLLTGSIPATLGNLVLLPDLDLSNNQLSGSIPSSLGNLVLLSDLDLSNNQLSGSIPATLGNLVLLYSLNLSKNQLSDSIPSELCNLKNIGKLQLYSNNLTGSLPSLLLTKLNYLVLLDLHSNSLTGPLPSRNTKRFFLDYFDLSNNQLTGRIPAEYGTYIRPSYVYLQNNSLSGDIPAGFATYPAKNTIVEFNVSGNYFTFNAIEQVFKDYPAAVYSPQKKMHVSLNSGILSVSAGGTPGKTTYKWYRGDTVVSIKTLDSTFKPTVVGNYSAVAINSIVTKLTLFSDTVFVIDSELPVTYINFIAQPTHNGNLLQWQTATEINGAYFAVQRSIDGSKFNVIANMPMVGNSNSVQSYAYTDALTGLTPVPPVLYYRLLQADKDGSISYSKIITLKTSGFVAPAIIIRPNPAHDVVNALLVGMEGPVDIAITGFNGKLLQKQQIKAVSGKMVSINTQNLMPGVYLLQVWYNKHNFVQKFIKQ
jgi:Leucine-rich repeat (LRR) protein